MRRPPRSSSLALLAVLAAAPAARAQDGVLDAGRERAARATPSSSTPTPTRASPQAEADALRSRITERDAGPMYIAVLPARAASEAGGSVDAALSELQSARRAPRHLRDRRRPPLPGGQHRRRARGRDARRRPTRRSKAERGEGLTAILLDFVDRMGEVRAGGGDSDSDGGGGGPGSAG